MSAKASLYQSNARPTGPLLQILESICIGIPVLSLASYGTLGKFLDHLQFQFPQLQSGTVAKWSS